MRINFHMLGKSFGGKRRAESASVQYGRDPRADWQLVFFVFLLLNLISFIGNVYVYRQISKGEIFRLPQKEPLSLRMLDRTGLKSAVDFFDAKQKQLGDFRRYSLVIDGPGPAMKKK